MNGDSFFSEVDFYITLAIAALGVVAVLFVWVVMRHRRLRLVELRHQQEVEEAAARREDAPPVFFRRYYPDETHSKPGEAP